MLHDDIKDCLLRVMQEANCISASAWFPCGGFCQLPFLLIHCYVQKMTTVKSGRFQHGIWAADISSQTTQIQGLLWPTRMACLNESRCWREMRKPCTMLGVGAQTAIVCFRGWFCVLSFFLLPDLIHLFNFLSLLLLLLHALVSGLHF